MRIITNSTKRSKIIDYIILPSASISLISIYFSTLLLYSVSTFTIFLTVYQWNIPYLVLKKKVYALDKNVNFKLRIFPAILCTVVFLGFSTLMLFIGPLYDSSFDDMVFPFLLGIISVILILFSAILSSEWKNRISNLFNERSKNLYSKFISIILIIGGFFAIGGDLIISIATFSLALGTVAYYRFRLKSFIDEVERIENSYLYQFAMKQTESRQVKIANMIIILSLFFLAINIRFISYFLSHYTIKLDYILMIITFILLSICLILSFNSIVSNKNKVKKALIGFITLISVLVIGFLWPFSHPFFFFLKDSAAFLIMKNLNLVSNSDYLVSNFSRGLILYVLLNVILHSTYRENFDYTRIKYYKTFRKIEYSVSWRSMILKNALFIIVAVSLLSPIISNRLNTIVSVSYHYFLFMFVFLGLVFVIFYHVLYSTHYYTMKNYAVNWIIHKFNVSSKEAKSILPGELEKFNDRKFGKIYNKKYYFTASVIFISSLFIYYFVIMFIHSSYEPLIAVLIHPEIFALIYSFIFIIPPSRLIIEDKKFDNFFKLNV